MNPTYRSFRVLLLIIVSSLLINTQASVVTLTSDTIKEFIASNKYTLVQFYNNKCIGCRKFQDVYD